MAKNQSDPCNFLYLMIKLLIIMVGWLKLHLKFLKNFGNCNHMVSQKLNGSLKLKSFLKTLQFTRLKLKKKNNLYINKIIIYKNIKNSISQYWKDFLVWYGMTGMTRNDREEKSWSFRHCLPTWINRAIAGGSTTVDCKDHKARPWEVVVC